MAAVTESRTNESRAAVASGMSAATTVVARRCVRTMVRRFMSPSGAAVGTTVKGLYAFCMPPARLSSRCRIDGVKIASKPVMPPSTGRKGARPGRHSTDGRDREHRRRPAVALALLAYLVFALVSPGAVLMSDTAAGLLTVLVLVLLLAVTHVPLGDYMARVYSADRAPGGRAARLPRVPESTPTPTRPGRRTPLSVLGFSV